MKVGDIVSLNTPHKAMRNAKTTMWDIHRVFDIFSHDKGRVVQIDDDTIQLDIIGTDYRLIVNKPIREGIFKEKGKC